MKQFASDVIDFNRQVLSITHRDKGLLSVPELNQTINCLREEIDEFHESHESGDYIASVDALIDLIYFAVGGLYRMGLDSDEISDCASAVHAANMDKKLGIVPRRGDGSSPDAIKSTEWTGPEHRLAAILGVI